jgi:hypothetical protein
VSSTCAWSEGDYVGHGLWNLDRDRRGPINPPVPLILTPTLDLVALSLSLCYPWLIHVVSLARLRRLTISTLVTHHPAHACIVAYTAYTPPRRPRRSHNKSSAGSSLLSIWAGPELARGAICDHENHRTTITIESPPPSLPIRPHHAASTRLQRLLYRRARARRR